MPKTHRPIALIATLLIATCAIPAGAKPVKTSKTTSAKQPAVLYASRPEALQFADDLAARRDLDREWVRQAIGLAMDFPTMPGTPTWAVFFFSQLASCLGIVVIVGSIALRWENQFVSIATGLALSLAGLFSSFLPAVLQRLVPSGYFTLLSCTRIDWVASISAPVFYETPFSWRDLMLLAAISAAFLSWSYASFSRREH